MMMMPAWKVSGVAEGSQQGSYLDDEDDDGVGGVIVGGVAAFKDATLGFDFGGIGGHGGIQAWVVR